MERKSKVLVYLPRKLYVELHERQLTNHVSYLVSRLLEEFLKATDVRISWAEMPSRAEQREYLERKLKEFFSQLGQSTEPPNQHVQEKAEPTRVQETPKEIFAPSKSEPVKEEPPTPPKEEDFDDDILKRIESLW
jgi:hypothetical protein